MKKIIYHILCLAGIGAMALFAPQASAQTVDLATHQPLPAATPAGAVFEWHNAIPVDASNLMTAAQIAAARAGLYYAVYHFTADGCYSTPAPLRIVNNDCPLTTVDIRKFVDSTAKPANSIVTWHTATPPTNANRMSVAAASTAAVPGTYFVSYWDNTEQCYAGAVPIVAVSKNCTPDFTPTNDIDALGFPTAGFGRDLVVNISELIDNPSNGAVVFRVRKISAFDITFNPTATTADVNGGTPVNNADWTFTQDANFITVTLKAGKSISGFGISAIGFRITRRAGVPPATSQNFSATIVNGSGTDSNNFNNTTNTTITAN